MALLINQDDVTQDWDGRDVSVDLSLMNPQDMALLEER
jgi:hypothetical protein